LKKEPENDFKHNHQSSLQRVLEAIDQYVVTDTVSTRCCTHRRQYHWVHRRLDEKLPECSRYHFIGSIIGELAAFGLLVWQLHRRGQTLRDIGWGQPTRWWAIAPAITYIVGKRSLTPVIISHALIDMIIEPWLFVSFFL
jgi:hypothetical protein